MQVVPFEEELGQDRQVILALGSAAVAWPSLAAAQQGAMPTIGFLSSNLHDAMLPFVAAFKEGLAEAGYIEGQNVAI